MTYKKEETIESEFNQEFSAEIIDEKLKAGLLHSLIFAVVSLAIFLSWLLFF